MNIVLTHPTGNRNVRAVISSLEQEGMLMEFATTLYANPSSKLLNLLPHALQQECLRRSFSIESNQIWTHSCRELARLVLPRIGLSHLTRHEYGWASVDSVYRNLDHAFAQRLSKLSIHQKIDAVYAYEDGALDTFLAAKKRGITCIYDLPIAYWEKVHELLNEEAERLPMWKKTLGGGINDSAKKLERKTHELELADIVVCPGDFVLRSIPKWAKKRIIISPFGSPISYKGEPSKQNFKEPLRVLFVGSMGQRKGLGDLFSAIKLLNRPDLELVIMGSMLDTMDFYRSELPDFTYEHTRPYNQVLALMRTCHVFCLPSIVEGRALVMQEAMSQGLPLIITSNTGGEDLVIEGKTGFLVPIRSPEAIAEKLTWFLENRSAIPQMSKDAQQHAAEYTWEYYGENITRSLANFIS